MNQREKRDRLPADGRLRTAGAAIQAWWQNAYLADGNAVLPRRFADEARASLPGLTELSSMPALGEVFGALQIQRLRLRHDRQLPEWAQSVTTVSARG